MESRTPVKRSRPSLDRLKISAAMLAVAILMASSIATPGAQASGAPAPTTMTMSGTPQLGRFVTIRFNDGETPVGDYLDIWVCSAEAFAADRRPDDDKSDADNEGCVDVTFWERAAVVPPPTAVKFALATTASADAVPALNPDDDDDDFGLDIDTADYCGAEGTLKDVGGNAMLPPYYLITHDFWDDGPNGGHSNWFGPIDCEEVDDPNAPLVPFGSVTSPVEEAVAVAVRSASELSGTDGVVVRRNVPVPLVSTTVPTVGPRGGLVLEDDEGELKVTISTAAGVSPTAGVVVPTDGEIVCEVCARLGADSVVEAWVLSEPRLAAAVRVEVDGEDADGCPLLRIPVGSPLDGGGAIEPGAHTLQLRMYTEDGFEVLAVPITIGDGTPVPARINAGGGPVPLVPLSMLLVVALLGAIALTTEHGRIVAASGAAERQARLRASARHRLPAFDTLQRQLDERRRTMRSGG